MESAPPIPQPGPTTLPYTTVRLIIKAEKLKNRDYLSKNDPMCVMSMLQGRLTGFSTGRTAWKEAGRTEMIRNANCPEWAKAIEIDYYFEEKQTLKFDIYDVDSTETAPLSEHDYLGNMECDLAEIVSAGTFTKALGGLKGSCGTITVTCEEVDDGNREVIVFNPSGEKLDKKDLFGKSDPYLKIYRKNDDGSKTLVYRTEFVKKTLNPTWRQFEINLKTLCGGDRKKSIFIECWDNDDDQLSDHDYIGSCDVVVEDLIRQSCTAKPLINEKKQAKKGKKYTDSGILKIQTKHIVLPTFLDFIAGGTQLDFSVAVDFTSSNGQIHKPTSLHFISSGNPNQYEIATKAVLDICQHYNNSKLFDAYGFGARIDPHPKMVPVFSLIDPKPFVSQPAVVGVEGVMYAYRRALNHVRLYGPTNFSPIISQAMRATAEKMSEPGARYHVLLIITDGDISDMNATKKAIIDAAGLPLSIIIVGVGNDTFEKMDELDGDDVRLSVNGRIAERDIVQFVPMSKFTSSGSQFISDTIMARLAKEVLAEVPLQLTSYMRRNNILPRPADNPFPRDAPAEPMQMPPISPYNSAPVPMPSSPRGSGAAYGTPPYGAQNGYPPANYQQYPPQPGFVPPQQAYPYPPQPGYPPQQPQYAQPGYPPQQPQYNQPTQPYPPQGYQPYPPQTAPQSPYPPQQYTQNAYNQQSAPYGQTQPTYGYDKLPTGAPPFNQPTPPPSAPYDATAPPINVGDIDVQMAPMQNLAIH